MEERKLSIQGMLGAGYTVRGIQRIINSHLKGIQEKKLKYSRDVSTWLRGTWYAEGTRYTERN